MQPLKNTLILLNIFIVIYFAGLRSFYRDSPLFPGTILTRLAGNNILMMQHIDFTSAVDTLAPEVVPCDQAKKTAAIVDSFINGAVFKKALQDIQTAFAQDLAEHAIAFGRNMDGSVVASSISTGNSTGAHVPFVQNAFADLHNHPNNLPPDAGDIYGLIDININNPGYNTRLAITRNGTLYALLVTDPVAATIFNTRYPRQQAPYAGLQPAFPVKLVDEFREIKYRHGGTDEMALAFLLEKYNTGVVLMKQLPGGGFKLLRTTVKSDGDKLVYIVNECP